MRFNVQSRLEYRVDQPTVFVFNVEAAALRNQRIVSETLTLDPAAAVDRHEVDGTRLVRVLVEPGTFTSDYSALVELDMHVADPATVNELSAAELPLEVMAYLNPSRFCQSDLLCRFAQREFGEVERGHARVTHLCNWIYDHVDYVRGASDPQTSAYDTFVLRAGVCRDFAHLGIAFCRALGIPARFASAYAWQLDPPDFHAVFEAYLGGQWYLFDPTRQAALQGLVRVGVGRDAADAAFATIHGSAEMTGMSVGIEAAGPVADAEPTVQAVGIA